jgi:CO dehydrogenase nickel-insertion accessory protein CooC1
MDQLPAAFNDALAKLDVALIGTIPNDPVMAEFEFMGRPLVQLPHDTQVVKAVYQIADKIFANGHKM